MAIKKYFIFLLLPLLLITSLSCGRAGRGTMGNVLYWSSNNTDEINYARYVVEKWNREHPGDNVVFQPVPEGQSSEEVILAAVVGGTTPDLYSNMWQGDVEYYARAGKLIALDTLPGFTDFIYNRCDSATIEEVRSTDGHIYQIPWKINPIMMIYNKGMLKDLGRTEPPRTYSEFLAVAKQIKQKYQRDGHPTKWAGYAEVQVTWWQRWFDYYPLYLAASGGKRLVAGNQAVFSNTASVQAFSFLQELYRENYFPTDRLSSGRDPFLGGDILTRFTGPWEIAHAEKFKPDGFEYGFAPMPVPDDFKGDPYTYGDTKNIVLFKTCADVQLAWAFLREFLEMKNEKKFLDLTNQFPRRKDLVTNPLFSDYFSKNPMMFPFAIQTKHVVGPDVCPVLKEVFDVISLEYEASVVYDRKPARQAVADAAKATNLVLLQ